MNTRLLLSGIVTTGLALAAAPALADRDREFSAKLQSVNEVPSVITGASGRFKLEIDRRSGAIEWELRYQDLKAPATQAHIHVGQPQTAGGISVFLCSNLPNPPAGTQACGTFSDRIRGTITAANVIGPAGQGVSANDLEALLDAIKRGAAYANVHSTMFPTGEIRGQIKRDDD